MTGFIDTSAGLRQSDDAHWPKIRLLSDGKASKARRVARLKLTKTTRGLIKAIPTRIEALAPSQAPKTCPTPIGMPAARTILPERAKVAKLAKLDARLHTLD